MSNRAGSKIAATLAIVCALSPGLFEAQSQQRRRQPSRRVTNPVRSNPSTPTPDYEPRVVSTAEEQAAQEGQTTTQRTTRRNRPAVADPEQDATRKTLETVLEEFGKLNKKVDDLEKERRSDLIQERLTRAEQRAEGLQTQLRDVLEKESNLQAQIERVDEQLRPESIERQSALTGTFRPDELRESIRRQLEAEKRRLRGQLDLLAASRTRLETSLNNADQIVQRLRSQLDAATQRELEGEESGTLAAPRPTPEPAATPPPQ
jgi:hypothetical protein